MQNPFVNDNRPKPESSWLTDIERIQADITKDLELAKTASVVAPEHVNQDQVNEYDWPDETRSPDLWLAPDADALSSPVYSASLQPGPESEMPGGFYRETIKTRPKHRSWAKTVAVILLICTVGASSLGFGLGSAYFWAREQTRGITYIETGNNPAVSTITSSQYVFDPGSRTQAGTVADMVQLLEPAVVGITSRFDTGNRSPIAGSGTIFAENDDRIFIVTGEYVIRGAAQILVRVSGSQPLLARRVDGDPRSGLAVISLDKQQLLDAGIDSVVIASFGNSDDMLVGDTVFAIGNARNEGNSVTRGIISAGKQELVFPGYSLTVLQTDAAINYGNSGGPLINISGEIIGINIDRVYAQFGQVPVEGIGYSIAANVALPILNSFIDPNRPAIGITGQTLNEELVAIHELNIPAMGVFVVSIAPGGAAERSGILPYDVITAFAGESVFTMEELQQAIRRRHIGEVVEVRVLRGGNTPIVLELELRAFIQ